MLISTHLLTWLCIENIRYNILNVSNCTLIWSTRRRCHCARSLYALPACTNFDLFIWFISAKKICLPSWNCRPYQLLLRRVRSWAREKSPFPLLQGRFLQSSHHNLARPWTLVAQSLYGVFPVSLGQFVSVTYPRRTDGSRDLKRFGREEKWGLGNRQGHWQKLYFFSALWKRGKKTLHFRPFSETIADSPLLLTSLLFIPEVGYYKLGVCPAMRRGGGGMGDWGS